jgi:hypothetical protein
MVFAGDPVDESSTMKAAVPADSVGWNFAELGHFIESRSSRNAPINELASLEFLKAGKS